MTLNEWLDKLKPAITEAREGGTLDHFIDTATTALLKMDPCDLRGDGWDGPRRAGFYRSKVTALVYPVDVPQAA